MHILVYPHDKLRMKSEDVTEEQIFSKDIEDFLIEMHTVLRGTKGKGIAAIQVGNPINVFSFHTKGKFLTLFNSKIIAKSGNYRVYGEECLSLPKVKYDVKRYKKVVITALDLQAKPVRLKFTNYEAACVQHELDHINGKLYIDHLRKRDRTELLELFERRN